MAITVTFYGANRPTEGRGSAIDAVGAQIGDAIEVEDDDLSDPLVNTGLYRIKATGDCVVRIGPATLEDAEGGEIWSEGEKEYRLISAGQIIAVDAVQ